MKTLRDPGNPAYTGPMAESHHEGPDPREFFRLLWRRKALILICLIVLPLAAYAYSQRLTKTYEASTLVSVQGTASETSLVVGDTPTTGAANTAQVAALVSTDAVADQASRLLGEPRGSLRGAATGRGRREDRLHHDHCHRGKRRARRADRERLRPGSQGGARACGRRPHRCRDRQGAEGARQAPAGGRCSTRSCRSSFRRSGPCAPLRARTCRWCNRRRRPRPRCRRTRSATRSSPSSWRS